MGDRRSENANNDNRKLFLLFETKSNVMTKINPTIPKIEVTAWDGESKFATEKSKYKNIGTLIIAPLKKINE